jgi:hypothetical protein
MLRIPLLPRLIVASAVALLSLVPAMAEKAEVDEAEVLSVVDMIERLPVWTTASEHDRSLDGAILKAMAKLDAIDTNTIDAAIRLFWGRYCMPTSKGTNIRAWNDGKAKIYLLNRYLFDVPEWVKGSVIDWGGEFMPPYSESGIPMLWPLKRSTDGRLEIAHYIPTEYVGGSYDGVRDWIFIKEHYPRRSMPEASK